MDFLKNYWKNFKFWFCRYR